MYKLHPQLSSMISEKNNSTKHSTCKKSSSFFTADVSNKLDEIYISGDINKLVNFEIPFICNQFPYSL